MLFNVVELKEEYTVEDVELTLGELCNVVKNNYGGDSGGFIGGQVFRSAGFISNEGSLLTDKSDENSDVKSGGIIIITYWKSFDLHEMSHADELFKNKFDELAKFCDKTYEIGYDMLWQSNYDDE